MTDQVPSGLTLEKGSLAGRSVGGMLLLGVVLGAGSLMGGQAIAAHFAARNGCASCERPVAASSRCPMQRLGDEMNATDPSSLRMRRAMRDGVFRPWVELGRAPTPNEIGERLRLDVAATTSLMDAMNACGDEFSGGILRVPQSDLIAVAWPFSNVPTDITVKVAEGKPVFARCAIDALGVSKMMGKPVTIDARAHDGGTPVRVTVDGERITSAEPAGTAVLHGGSCDDIVFFSSKEAAEAWRAAKAPTGKVYTLEDALRRGARIFGSLTRELPE